MDGEVREPEEVYRKVSAVKLAVLAARGEQKMIRRSEEPRAYRHELTDRGGFAREVEIASGASVHALLTSARSAARAARSPAPPT